jgi:hypothetical protein
MNYARKSEEEKNAWPPKKEREKRPSADID